MFKLFDPLITSVAGAGSLTDGLSTGKLFCTQDDLPVLSAFIITPKPLAVTSCFSAAPSAPLKLFKTERSLISTSNLFKVAAVNLSKEN